MKHKKPNDIDSPTTQNQFASLVGTSIATINRLVGTVLTRDAPLRVWIKQYVDHLVQKQKPSALNDERTKLIRAQRERAELELVEHRSTLVDRIAVDAYYDSLCSKARAKFRALPAKAIRRVQGMTDVGAVEKILEEQINAVLLDLTPR